MNIDRTQYKTTVKKVCLARGWAVEFQESRPEAIGGGMKDFIIASYQNRLSIAYQFTNEGDQIS